MCLATVYKKTSETEEMVLKNTTKIYVDGVEVSDNDFDLLPGRETKVVVTVDAEVSYEPEVYSLNSGMMVNIIVK